MMNNSSCILTHILEIICAFTKNECIYYFFFLTYATTRQFNTRFSEKTHQNTSYQGRRIIYNYY